MTPKPRFQDEYHKEQRKKMMESRGFSQNQQDLVNFFQSGGSVAVKGQEIKPVDKPFTFRVQRNTIFSLQRRGLLACEHKDGWDYYALKSEVYTEKEDSS